MILVTGAHGFVGRALSRELKARQFSVLAAVRAASESGEVGVGNIDSETNWREALNGIDVVVHTAARVHVMNDTADDPLDQFRRVNVEGTLNLARQAVSANVKRFIYISSIKVNGELTATGTPFVADDIPDPADLYGISKWEAEIGLTQLASETGLEVVIIRPPLVYGPGVKANFQRMMRWVKRGIPLPLGAIDNKRSLVSMENLVDLIITCIEHPAAANQVFLAGDGQDVSTTELLRGIGEALGKPARLYPCPGVLLSLVATLLGQKEVVQRLTGNLQVDISATRSRLGWEPPASVEEGLRQAVQDFKS